MQEDEALPGGSASSLCSPSLLVTTPHICPPQVPPSAVPPLKNPSLSENAKVFINQIFCHVFSLFNEPDSL